MLWSGIHISGRTMPVSTVESFNNNLVYLPLARHAANEYKGWVKIVKQFRLSHKPRGLASIERVTV